MNKIKSPEQAARECLELWTEIEKGVLSGKFKMFRNKCGLYNVVDIKGELIGKKGYAGDCPLCEYHRLEDTCPLSYYETVHCNYGCLDYGYADDMTPEEILVFKRDLKEILEVE